MKKAILLIGGAIISIAIISGVSSQKNNSNNITNSKIENKIENVIQDKNENIDKNTTTIPETNLEKEETKNQEKTCEYILNTNTKKFHYPGCSSASKIKETNKKVYNGTREEVIAMGYSSCKKCNP